MERYEMAQSERTVNVSFKITKDQGDLWKRHAIKEGRSLARQIIFEMDKAIAKNAPIQKEAESPVEEL
jgi:hypothetical protein